MVSMWAASPVVCGLMKPLVSAKALKIAIIIAGTVLVAIGEAPDLKGLLPDLWLHISAIAGTALLGKELLQRTGDVATTELPAEWVEAVSAAQPENKQE